MAALAVVIMCMGGLIPVATFVCPALCCVVLQLICGKLGNRLCWTWYVVVSLLVVLIGPDKESAAVFAFLGYYPIVCPYFPKRFLGLLLKAIYFNAATFAMYWFLIKLLGIEHIASDYADFGTAMLVLLVMLGNIAFFLLDRLLAIIRRRFP